MRFWVLLALLVLSHVSGVLSELRFVMLGTFTQTTAGNHGPYNSSGFVVWDDTNWTDYGAGILEHERVTAITTIKTTNGCHDIVIGGTFTRIAGKPSGPLAYYDCSNKQWRRSSTTLFHTLASSSSITSLYAADVATAQPLRYVLVGGDLYLAPNRLTPRIHLLCWDPTRDYSSSDELLNDTRCMNHSAVLESSASMFIPNTGGSTHFVPNGRSFFGASFVQRLLDVHYETQWVVAVGCGPYCFLYRETPSNAAKGSSVYSFEPQMTLQLANAHFTDSAESRALTTGSRGLLVFKPTTTDHHQLRSAVNVTIPPQSGPSLLQYFKLDSFSMDPLPILDPIFNITVPFVRPDDFVSKMAEGINLYDSEVKNVYFVTNQGDVAIGKYQVDTLSDSPNKFVLLVGSPQDRELRYHRIRCVHTKSKAIAFGGDQYLRIYNMPEGDAFRVLDGSVHVIRLMEATHVTQMSIFYLTTGSLLLLVLIVACITVAVIYNRAAKRETQMRVDGLLIRGAAPTQQVIAYTYPWFVAAMMVVALFVFADGFNKRTDFISLSQLLWFAFSKNDELRVTDFFISLSMASAFFCALLLFIVALLIRTRFDRVSDKATKVIIDMLSSLDITLVNTIAALMLIVDPVEQIHSIAMFYFLVNGVAFVTAFVLFIRILRGSCEQKFKKHIIVWLALSSVILITYVIYLLVWLIPTISDSLAHQGRFVTKIIISWEYVSIIMFVLTLLILHLMYVRYHSALIPHLDAAITAIAVAAANHECVALFGFLWRGLAPAKDRLGQLDVDSANDYFSVYATIVNLFSFLLFAICIVELSRLFALYVWKRSKQREAALRLLDDETETISTESGQLSSRLHATSSDGKKVPLLSDDGMNSDLSDVRALLSTKSWYIPFEQLEFLRRLSEGAFGIVFEGVWKTNKTRCAIKKLKSSDLESGEMIRLNREFVQEANLLSSLRHPNIVLFLGVLQGVRYSTKCDIYSYAIVMWEMFYQRRPYDDAKNIFTLPADVLDGLRPTIHLDFINSHAKEPVTIESIAGTQTRATGSATGSSSTNTGEQRNFDGTLLVSSDELRKQQQFLRLMCRCWHADADARPELSDILNELTALLI